MTKSILATLYGIRQAQGGLNVFDTVGWPAWNLDERSAITYDDLLRMQSGLEWDENYNDISDVTKMLFLSTDMTLVQPQKKLVAAPESFWNYSSGATNFLSGLLRRDLIDYQEYLDFPYRELIDRIGMQSMLIETDLAGNYVASSYGWATTRDWAKFGLLYLHRGNWNGSQIFDPQWVDYITHPTSNSQGNYGAHFWLNAGGAFPNAPKDMYSANGFQGQYVFIIPSKNLVIVRTGLAESPEFDADHFLKLVSLSIL
jgi:CubicO group peptidase (beta-lactamase class C family)